ncbi:phosphoglycerate kinase [Patescibacteria group bacterium]|nr:phosphoglycerate kinase [Patescibacteria group bacterium]
MSELPVWKEKVHVSVGTRVILRLDLNLPKGSTAAMKKSWRLQKALEEVRRLQKAKARTLIVAHLGDPAGKKVAELSLKSFAPLLKSVLKTPVKFAEAYTGKKNTEIFESLEDGGVALAENLRFFSGEEKNDDRFASQLASGAEVYINNAFSVCHRKHASVFAITRHLPSFAGSLLIEEIEALVKPLKHPFVLVVGGAKIATKLPLLERLGPTADKIIIGGGPATSMLTATKVTLPAYPKAFITDDALRSAGRIYRRFYKKIVLPIDLVADPDKQIIFDHGPLSIKAFTAALKGAKTVIWNGPFGIIEKKQGEAATRAFAQALAKQKGLQVLVGGGETVDAILDAGVEKKMTHLSTGGGAMLAFLAGDPLPGLVALDQG